MPTTHPDVDEELEVTLNPNCIKCGMEPEDETEVLQTDEGIICEECIEHCHLCNCAFKTGVPAHKTADGLVCGGCFDEIEAHNNEVLGFCPHGNSEEQGCSTTNCSGGVNGYDTDGHAYSPTDAIDDDDD